MKTASRLAGAWPRFSGIAKRLVRLAPLAVAFILGAQTLAMAAESAMDYLFTAQEWQAKGNLEAARRSLQDAQRVQPDDVFTRIRLAQIDAADGDLKGAQSGLEQVLAGSPKNLLALNWLGHVMLAQGLPASADAAYGRVLAVEQSNGWALLGMAACRLAQGDDAGAALFLPKAQAAASQDAELHLALGETFSRLHLPVNARLELERSLEINPRGVRALTLAGEVYERLGLSSLALSAWRQALELDPAAASARFALVAVLGRQGDRALAEGRKDEAVRTWRSALSYDPTNQQVQARLRALQ